MARTAGTKSRRRNVESAIQRELIKWLNVNYPQVEVIFRKNEGVKSMITAILDELSGLTPGVPDLQFLTTVGGWTYILEMELKKKKGVLSANQIKWHSEFVPTKNRQLITSYGFQEARFAITYWLGQIQNARVQTNIMERTALGQRVTIMPQGE